MNEITLSQSQALAINTAIDHYNTLVHFVKRSLRNELDYGTIPGCGDKPVLFKPGAEKIATLFGLRETIERLEAIKDWTGKDFGGEPFFSFEYKTTLRNREGVVIAECVGSCNSWETKYRYRKAERSCPSCGKATIIKGKKEYGGGWLCFKNKGGCGAKFADGAPEIEGQQVGLIPNTAVYDQVNTIDKMAQKRSFVGAVILAANASNFFAVDHSEIQTIDADWEPAEPIEFAQEMQGAEVSYPTQPNRGKINRDRIATIAVLTKHTKPKIQALSGKPSADDLTDQECTRLLHKMLIDYAVSRNLSEQSGAEILNGILKEQPSITDSNLRDRFDVRLSEYRSEQPWSQGRPAEKYAGVSLD